MALYIVFEPDEISHICQRFGLGRPLSAEGIPQGSINTNYRLETEHGRFFLRHTSVRSEEELKFEVDLLNHLRESAFPAPHVVPTREGEPFVRMREGWVNLFTYLPGEELTRTDLTREHCENLGFELGKLHRVTNSFAGQRPNPYGSAVVQEWLDGLCARPEQDLRTIAQELREHLTGTVAAPPPLVPRGVIHADLFMDNVKWLAGRVSAFFDFEMACRDTYTLDVAITLNAWCFEGEYKPEMCSAFIAGYQRQRKLSSVERDDLFDRALYGAIRYTASRIRDFHLSPLSSERLVRKDFRTYLARVRALRDMGPRGFFGMLGLH